MEFLLKESDVSFGFDFEFNNIAQVNADCLDITGTSEPANEDHSQYRIWNGYEHPWMPDYHPRVVYPTTCSQILRVGLPDRSLVSDPTLAKLLGAWLPGDAVSTICPSECEGSSNDSTPSVDEPALASSSDPAPTIDDGDHATDWGNVDYDTVEQTPSASCSHASSSTSVQSSPSLTDGTTPSSISSFPPRLLGKRKRATEEDQEQENETGIESEQESESQAPTDEEQGFGCSWARVFGGKCNRVLSTKQEHDKHVLKHIPDLDGTQLNLFRCKICVDRWTAKLQSAAATSSKSANIKKQELGLFYRRDPCKRHVKGTHFKDTDMSKDEEDEVLLEDKAPWWWPSFLFLTDRYKPGGLKVQARPEGETRTSQSVITDTINRHPLVKDGPHEALHVLNNGGCRCAIYARLFKRRK